MKLAIFDLDNTLLNGDSDFSWNQFLCQKGAVDTAEYDRLNQQFHQDYKEGRLDVDAFLEFALKPLSQYTIDQLEIWHREFMHHIIEPMISRQAEALLEQHRQQGHYLLIITATNLFVTAPIAERLGVDDIIATEPERVGDRYTGKVVGTPAFQQGKVTRLKEWLEANCHEIQDSYFYSDSQNDIPLLDTVTYPCAVNPCPVLAAYAKERNWPILNLHSDLDNITPSLSGVASVQQ